MESHTIYSVRIKPKAGSSIQACVDIKCVFIGGRFPGSQVKTWPKSRALEKEPSFKASQKLYQKTLREGFYHRKLYLLAGFYSVNQSSLIFAPRGKTLVAVLAAVNGNESAIGFMT